MSHDEIKDIVITPFEEITLDAISPALEDIQGWLERFKLWGLNPGNVSLVNFEVAGILSVPAATPFPFISAGPQIVFRHKGTGKASVHQAYPPMGVRGSMFHYATAGTLVSLAQ